MYEQIHYFVNKPTLTICLALFQLLGNQIGIKTWALPSSGRARHAKVTYNVI